VNRNSPSLNVTFLGGLLLFALGLALYSQTFSSSFHFDDFHGIVGNFAIRNLNNPQIIWDAFNTRVVAGFSFALNYALGRFNVFGYHLFNFFCHLLTSLLVYALVSLTLQTPSMRGSLFTKQPHLIAYVAALLFLVHPIQTQAVTYIWQRMTSLAAFFYVASVVLYAKARLASRWDAYLGAFLATVLGMFTKEITLTIPLTLSLYEFCFFGHWKENPKKRLRLLLPFLLTLMIIPLTLTRSGHTTLQIVRSPSITTHTGEARTLPRFLSSITRWSPPEQRSRREYLLTQLNVTRTYLRLLFLPIRQNLDYDYPISHRLNEPGTFFSFLLLTSIFLFALKSFQKNRLIAFGIFWFFITLSVESLVVLPDVIFEHRLYQPMVGFSIFLSAGLFLLLRDARRFVALSSVIVLVFSIATYRRNGVWRDDLTLWQDAVSKSPQKARAHSSLGFAFIQKGDYDRAIFYCQRALQLNPDYPDTYAILGDVYFRKQDYNSAIHYYKETIQRDPSYAAIYHNLGVAYHAKGAYGKEIEYYQKAIQRDPVNALTYRNLGLAYLREGGYDRAIDSFQKTVELDPANAENYAHLGVAYGRKGEHDRALDYFKKAIALDPLDAEAHRNLGFAYAERGDRAGVLREIHQLRVLHRDDLADQIEQRLKEAPSGR